MENLERFVDLSETELATLRNKQRSTAITLIGIVLTFIVIGAWAGWRGSWLYVIGFFLMLVFVILFLARDKLQSVQSLNKDIREGKKKIVVASVESQRQDIRQTGGSGDVVYDALDNSPSMSYAYLIKVKGKELKVSERQYYQCRPGQLVEIQLAPNSNHVFSLRVLEDSAAEIKAQTESAQF